MSSMIKKLKSMDRCIESTIENQKVCKKQISLHKMESLGQQWEAKKDGPNYHSNSR